MSARTTQRHAIVLAAVFAGATVAACATQPAETKTAATPKRASGELFSEPVEWADKPISREAGETYFTETGVGDPYGAGIAYPLFLALLRAYPSELGGDPRGFAKLFGFLEREPGDASPLPLGFHVSRDPLTGVSMVTMSCALCHAERLRLGDRDRLVLGLGNRRVRVHAYERAILRIATDPKLDRRKLLAAADELAQEQKLAWPTDVGERFVELTLAEWRRRAAGRLAVVEKLGDGLPGRVATIESFTLAMNAHAGLSLPIAAPYGFTRVPDVRSFRFKETLSYDGVGIGSPVTLVAEADFAFGARPAWYDAHRHIGTSLYLFLREFERDLPFPRAIDASLAERGRGLFSGACARCHGVYGKSGQRTELGYEETIVPLEVIGTDPARANAVTQAFADAANAEPLTRGLVRTRATHGYVPPPLVDVWMRGPFGHDGQWPTLAVLATKPEARPKRFAVHPELPYDLDGVGTAWSNDTTKLGDGGYVFDAKENGASPAGHTYLSDLGPDGAKAVIEYLKTL